MQKTRILLIRHGESEANRESRFAGHSDFPLSEKGLKQAHCTAEYISKNYRVDAVYASDLKRAFDTAKATAERLSLQVTPDPAFREIFAGAWEGMPFEEIRRDYPEDYTVWMTDIGRAGCTDGEKVSALQERVLSAILRLCEQNPGKTLVIGTHATPIRATECALRGLPLSEMHSVAWVSNASVTELCYENGRLTLVSSGESRHLSHLHTSLPSNV